MSNTTPYISYLEQPELILQADVEVFHQWVEQYPYAPIFRVLLAAKYQSLNHTDAAKYLEEAAFFVQDRKQLKHLLRSWNERFALFQQSTIQEDTLPQFETEETSNSEKNNFIPPLEKVERLEEIISDEKEEGILTDSEKQELSEILPNGVHTEVDNIVEIDTTEEVIEEEEEEEEATELLVENFLENDILPDDENSTPIELNESPEENTEEVQLEESITDRIIEEEEETTEELVIEEIIYSETTIAIEQTEELIEEAPTEEDDIAFLKSIGKYEEPVVEDAKVEEWELTTPSYEIPSIDENSIIDAGLVDTDISWLAPWMEEISLEYTASVVPKEKKQTTHVEKTSDTKEIVEEKPVVETKTEEKTPEVTQPIPEEKSSPAPIITSAHSFDEWLSILEQKKQNSSNAPVFDLPTPEVFSKEEMQSEAVKNEMEAIQAPKEKTEAEGSVKKLAAESVSFKKDMATETLAKLYIRQGKNDLAIAIYQQLMNKFPEKSSYFADQINLLK